MYNVDTVVIGAGVVGLAVASKLAENNSDLLLLESNAAFGEETSSRHSEVIHAGIYYKQNSLKATLCVRGKHLLYEYCQKHNVPHKNIGKLIVATTTEQLDSLDGIIERAQLNGVDDLTPLSQEQIKQLEPAIQAHAGLHSPSTGIVDSHSYMLSLLGKAESNGAQIAYRSSVIAIEPINDGFSVRIESHDDQEQLTMTCRQVVNAAGHGAINIARATASLTDRHVPKLSRSC